MEQTIANIQAQRTLQLCLFQKDYLLKLMGEHNYSIEVLNDIINSIIGFCKISVYPKIYSDQLFRQLSVLQEIDDDNKKERRNLITRSIVKINETIATASEDYHKEAVIVLLNDLEKSINGAEELNSDRKKQITDIIENCITKMRIVNTQLDLDDSEKMNVLNKAINTIRELYDDDIEYTIICSLTDDFKKEIDALVDYDGYTEIQKSISSRIGKKVKVNDANVEHTIQLLIPYLQNELIILTTLVNRDIDENDAIGYSASDSYYISLKYLIEENDILLRHPQFLKNAKYIQGLKNNKHIKSLVGGKIYRQLN